jgi:SecD/SecF fusion protein
MRGVPGGRIAIVLDGVIASAPTVNEPITGGQAQISGNFTRREAIDLVNVLDNPLDVELKQVQLTGVPPTMAQDAITSGQRAFILGTSLVAVFMIVYYMVGGVVSVIAMAFNVTIILGSMAVLGATMSMPGIAAVVLTLGMSVDSNILIFERIREELATGKNVRASLEAGFEKAFSAIIDANITTLITAAIMILFGTGPVKGFGVTLTIGIFSTIFAALVVTRVLLEIIVHNGIVKRLVMLQAIPHTTIDFMKYARPAFMTSWAIVLIGVVVVAVKGKDIYGIDFVGGDEITLGYTERIDEARLRAAAVGGEVRDIIPTYRDPMGAGDSVLKIQAPFEKGSEVAARLKAAFPDAGLTELGEVTQIGPAISSQIKWNAFLAIGLSLVGILLYVAFRFEFGYGVGAVVATIHDLIMTIGIFVMFDRQFNASMVGAVLLVCGYSINDTIVVFDRIREELTLNPNMRLRDVINLSLNRTLSRTLITSSSTLVTAAALLALATGAVNDIALTLIIGIVTGTFSSVFIASPIFFWWHKGDRKHVEASHDIAPKYEWSASSRAAE